MMQSFLLHPPTPNTLSYLPPTLIHSSVGADETYTLYGGGYGHGLGMSQNGANGLAKTGMNYQDILHFFYKDVSITSLTEKSEFANQDDE